MVEEKYKAVRLGPKKINIPYEWELDYLNNISNELYAGGTPSRSNANYFDGEILWVKSGELNQNFIVDTEEKITQEALKNSSAKLVPENNVVVAMYGATAGQVGFLKKKATTNQAVLAIVSDDVNSLYLYYLLSKNMKRIVAQRQQGTGQQNLSKKLINDIKVILPPLSEQKKIATVLYDLDKAIKKTEEIIEQLQKIKRGLMQELLTHGYYKHNDFKKVRFGTVPNNWELVSLSDLGSFKNGLDFSSEQKGEGTLIANVPNVYGDKYIKCNELARVNINESELDRFKLEKEDIILVRSSKKEEGIGQAAIFKGTDEPVVFAGFTIRFRPNNDKINPNFLIQYLRSPKMRKRVVSISRRLALTNISQKDYGKLTIPVPSKEEQKMIVDVLNNFDQKIELKKSQKEIFNLIKRGLMQDLLTGKVRTKDKPIEISEEVMEYG